MLIAVCIKQVPLVWAMKFDPAAKTLQREGVPSEISSFDVRALAKAVQLKAVHGGEVVALTMGPPQARVALEECLALGADRAVHLCDRGLAGSDTLATARALAAALRREAYDLILCGRHSVDAETGQVGPEVAELLDLPQITAARTLDIDPVTRRLRAERETDVGHDLVECALPAVVTAAEDLAPEPDPTMEEREAAKSRAIETLSLADLGVAVEQVGVEGSPTWVTGFETIISKRLAKVARGESLEGAVNEVVEELLARGLFGEWTSAESTVLVRDTSPLARSSAKDIWVLVEWFGDRLRPVTLELLTKARHLATRLGSKVAAVIVGAGASQLADSLAHAGADIVLVADDARLDPHDTDLHAAVLAAAIRARQPGMVLAPSTAIGRDVAPRVAARLGLGLTGDCLDLELDGEGRLRQLKPAFGGSIVSPILSKTLPEMATVRPGILSIDDPDLSRRVVVETLEVPTGIASRVRVVARVESAQAATALDDAEVVVGIGMGLGHADQLAAVQPLAKVLGAAICATRDVTDSRWLERQYQVGFTGRSIAPRLYIAIGIRGAVYHMVGVRRSGIIVAVNKDPRAPVFKAADYGIVGDWAAVVPLLTRRLELAKEQRR